MPANPDTRLVALLAYLASSRKPQTQPEIFEKLHSHYVEGKSGKGAKSFEASEKMLDRDLEALASLGIPIVSEPLYDPMSGKEDGVAYRLLKAEQCLDRNFLIDAQSASQLRELLTDTLVQAQLPAPALRALSRLLAFHAPFDETGKGEAIVSGGNNSLLTRLQSFAQASLSVEIEYPASGVGDMQRRLVSPCGFYFRLGTAYMCAVCHRDRFVKVFNLAKIRRAAAGRESYIDPPKDFDLEKHSKRNAFRLADTETRKAKIKVAPSAAWRLRDRTPSAITKEHSDGSLEAEFDVNFPVGFYRYILAFGGEAEIMSPVELRQGLGSFIQEALK